MGGYKILQAHERFVDVVHRARSLWFLYGYCYTVKGGKKKKFFSPFPPSLSLSVFLFPLRCFGRFEE